MGRPNRWIREAPSAELKDGLFSVFTGVGMASKPGGRGWEDSGLEVLGPSDFEGSRLHRSGTYAVCFGASWCFPTRLFVPKFAARKGRVPLLLAIADITEMESPLWDVFQIKITPTIILFRDGAIVGRLSGRAIVGLRNVDLDRMVEIAEESTAH